ncbi:helix-turn-helix domain-containing protein [Parasphingorhabdus sp. JC815]|uniref:helix-turn-helix domain-containing protein n=1 Tax=Parasphingorhabdus sp. JC815 TaxID=3232140 RepID=UPI003457A4F4
MIDPPFSPQTLAKRWNCTPQFIRDLVEAGELDYFKLGKKLIRIPAAAVVRFECENLIREHSSSNGNGGSASIEENSLSSGTELPDNHQLEYRLGRMTVGSPKLSLVVSGTPTINPKVAD